MTTTTPHTTIRRTAAALCAAVLVTLVPTGHATAAAPGCTSDPAGYSGPAVAALCWPLARGSVVAIQGPRRAWGLRSFARRATRDLAGVTVRSVTSCAEAPGAVCVTIVKQRRDDVPWAGHTDWNTTPSGRIVGATVQLNKTYRTAGKRTKRQVAAHEFMHVLGFKHHDGPGLVSLRPGLELHPTPSADERAALGEWYGFRGA